jgi:hypothetical protein
MSVELLITSNPNSREMRETKIQKCAKRSYTSHHRTLQRHNTFTAANNNNTSCTASSLEEKEPPPKYKRQSYV